MPDAQQGDIADNPDKDARSDRRAVAQSANSPEAFAE